MTRNKVILVDKQNNELAVCDKLEAHQKGLLHRAFSIVIYNSRGEVLLQKRAKNKYHSGGLWSNTCCSHPQPNEPTNIAIHLRLQEEMGFDCPLTHVGDFIYKTHFQNGLIEYEFDSVFLGLFDGSPLPSPDEVEEYKWESLPVLKEKLLAFPQFFTYWFPFVLDKYP
ncbi:isopentenyl-diphosphate Delta-isomerase [Runella salmonicolor]|uniref:isopentenyl-diphosphate Delta-isomerase n=1 Tax=Runella salmonicolor TaxID=2950278 RepID=A0ABT1FTW9_9BACT|nr:isopentenyl-diphosphate Delta-isomerase [Runella salmonicolor]MCP1384935.1 isopentenyl-diphosphate Delta-isomerase [Runella salmonicolor]